MQGSVGVRKLGRGSLHGGHQPVHRPGMAPWSFRRSAYTQCYWLTNLRKTTLSYRYYLPQIYPNMNVLPLFFFVKFLTRILTQRLGSVHERASQTQLLLPCMQAWTSLNNSPEKLPLHCNMHVRPQEETTDFSSKHAPCPADFFVARTDASLRALRFGIR